MHMFYVCGFLHLLTLYSRLIAASQYLSLRLRVLNSALVGQLQDGD